MKRYLFLLCPLFYLVTGVSHAQYNSPRNKVWAFGHHLGIDFNGSAPVFVNTSIFTGEGSASVCDQNGALLFYTEGTSVYNASGTVMPHGDTIYYGPFNTYSTSQAALIVPFPGNPQRYYVFSLFTSLYCSVVDMNLDNGNGDVDTSFSLSGIVLSDNMTEKMIAIAGCNNNIWVLVHPNNTAQFFAYEITAAGLNVNPVVSNAGTFPIYSYYAGVLKASPSGERIMSCNIGAGLELYDFDRGTGMVSNPVVLDSTSNGYGGSFSPDGRKVYRLHLTFGLYQYDLDAPDPAQSKLFLGPVTITDLRLGPDGKIYFNTLSNVTNGTSYIGCIHNPDVAGLGCNLEYHAVPFPKVAGQVESTLGLPNEVVSAGHPTGEGPVTGIIDTAVCHFPSATGMPLNAQAGYSHYLWDNGTTGISRTIMQRGTYWVKSVSGCDIFTDTFKVRGTQVPLVLIFSNPMISANSGFASYQWYRGNTLIPGATQASLNITANGWYSVAVTDAADCDDSAAIEVAGWTGINDPSAPGVFTIYPTLTHDKVYIKGTKNQVFNLSLSDVSGKTIQHISHSNTLDMNKISPGMYLLYIEDPVTRQRQYSKITKE